MTEKSAWIDFETYSEVDLTSAGGMAYVLDDSTNAICLTWAIDNGPVHLWTPRDPAPSELLTAIVDRARVYAHNLKFDFRIWNLIIVRDFGWPELDLDQCVDTMALAAAYGLPLNLADAGAAMKIKQTKHTIGKKLIKELCQPNKKGGQPLYHDPAYSARFAEFFEYGKRDVAAMREMVSKLPRNFLIPQEHKIWKLTYSMNSLGLPIAFEEVLAIREYLTKYIAEAMPQVAKLTKGSVEKVTQVKRIKDWCHAEGYMIPDITVNAVEEALEDPSCPPHVRKILELRQELGKSSVAKFTKLLAQAVPDENGQHWVYDNLEYHGAGPGRWSGRGFQMHNLPRAKVKDPDEWIVKFQQNEPIEDPVGIAKALIRPMIRAPKDHVLLVLDYNSIENKVLHWLADDTEALIDFANGVDQYKTMAAERFMTTYDQVTSEQRFMGKVIILGAGFGMGKDTFVDTAKKQFGIVVSIEEAAVSIQAYRTKYHKVKQLWNDLKVAAANTVLTGQQNTVRLITFGLARLNGSSWLAMRLPSGKSVYYHEPRVEQRYIPKYESMGKVPTVTHNGRHPKTGKWTRNALIPGRITENAVQGTAREIMARGLLNVAERMPTLKLIGTVHDEGLGVMHKDHLSGGSLDEFKFHLCDIPWAKDCPISASGYVGHRYKKD